MKTVRRFSWSKFLLFLITLIILLLIGLFGIYKFELSAPGKSKKPVVITIKKGDNFYNISNKLKKENLIRSELFYKIYLKLNKPGGIAQGDYELNKTKSVPEIVKILSDKNNQKIDNVKLTFREGLNIRDIAKIINENANIDENEFISKMEDREYINSLKADFPFLTDEITNEQIYYPLEGYLFPDTYIFERKKISTDAIVRSMLNTTQKKLETYKERLNTSGYTFHQILTLASLIEQEAVSDEDRALVSGVFYNRLKANMSLGSDVTTYYAAKKTLKESLTQAELDSCNGYNTRCKTMKTLPVGPIDNPSMSSINAALNPTPSDYYYFVADVDRNVYFTKTLNEHNQTVSKLKKEGKWAA